MDIKIPESGVFRISASAGSGKTYSLTRLFIRRMLRDRDAFKGMLAITFTNKAANELRERILKRLFELSQPAQDAGEKDLFGFKDRESLALRASEVLESVLHQADYLQIGTIDSFFQQVFTGLALELGLPPGLRTELSLQGIQQEMLEDVLSRKDPEAIRILVENLSRQLQDSGKDWRMVPYLQKNLLKAVFEEPVVTLFLSGETESLSEESLQKASATLQDHILSIKREVADSASALSLKLQELGIRPDTLDPGSEASFCREIDKLWEAAQGLSIPGPSVNHAQKGKFTYKLYSRPFSNAELAELEPLIFRYGASRTEGNMANLKLAENLLRNLISVRLLIHLRSVLQDLNKNRNRFLLHEVKYLLAEFLTGSEVPYLFEKTGSRLHTLLIDEFQDTDKIQWKVLHALASAVVDNGGLFAVVGDVKQSIYGWRGADSRLFKSGLDRDLHPARIAEESLEWNFRSESYIVDFNNWLFLNLSNDLAGHLLDAGHVQSIERWQEIIRKNYEDVAQKSAAAKARPSGGFVEVRVREKSRSEKPDPSLTGADNEEEETTPAFDWLPSEIMRLQDSGFSASDIAILVRTNADATAVIRVLDQARRSDYSGYDFTFSASAGGKASDQALFIFLVLLMKMGSGKMLLPFELEQIRRLGCEIGLDTFFQNPVWAEEWRQEKFYETEPDGIWREQAMYFGLEKLSSQQFMLVHFQELLSAYWREEAFRYPDFFTWWQQRAPFLEVPLASAGTGLTVMTIHRSKGLDFGVVILPVMSTAQGDSKALHDADFWASGNSSPWNCHPLLRTSASKGMLDTDVWEAYQEDVFSRAAEILNTFYVACTRPRYGLVMDITMDWNPGKQEKALYRIPFKTMSLLSQPSLPFSPEDFSLETETPDYLLRFLLGSVRHPFGNDPKEKNPEQDAHKLLSFLPAIHSFKPEKKDSNSGQRTGILVHRVLEKTARITGWKEVLRNEQSSGQWLSDEIERAEKILMLLFEIPEMKDWFSGEWTSFPEQNLISPEGKIMRADRILIKNRKAVILDYKTGDQSESHLRQMSEYITVFEKACGLKTEGWLLYSLEKSIRRVEVG
jgi:ATP-dependent exoDNAse (exonuclease V) beta subunit